MRLIQKTTMIFLILAMTPSAYAGKVELTTYYPAPYGEYKTLSTTENAAFASTSGGVNVGSTTNHAILAVDNTLTLAPVTGNAGAQSGGTAGSIRYSSDGNGAGVGGMLYSDGSSWKNLGGAEPDYDSGWVADNTTDDHLTTFSHQLGVLPRRTELFFATSSSPASIYSRSINTYGLSNPVTVRLTSSTVIFTIKTGTPLFRYYNETTYAENTYNTGYWRLLLWE